MAIIALIATPVILNIIDDSRKSTNEQSINLYGRAVENAVANYMLVNPSKAIPKGSYTQSSEGKTLTGSQVLTVDYDGNKVECDTININSDGSVYLANCKINDVEVEYIYGELIGDVNNDGILNKDDVISLSRYLFSNEILQNSSSGDVDGDRKITVTDINELSSILGKVTAASDETGILGDVDGNGLIETEDAKTIGQYVAALITINEFVFNNSDTNSDGILNIDDYSYLLRAIEGMLYKEF